MIEIPNGDIQIEFIDNSRNIFDAQPSAQTSTVNSVDEIIINPSLFERIHETTVSLVIGSNLKSYKVLTEPIR
jgi:hypothetical protein